MATRRYKVSVGETKEQVVEEVGAAVNSDTVELTIELANTAVNDAGATRTLNKQEALRAIDAIRGYIEESIWPPA